MADDRRDPVQWQFTGAAGAVRPGQSYGLMNTENGDSIVYGERNFGINMEWDPKNVGGNIRIERASGARDAIRHGDFIALHVKGGKFLRYEVRESGPNLGWADKPVDEWQVVGGKLGDALTTGQEFALRSKTEDDLLVYAVRKVGLNVRWDKDYTLRGDESWTGAILQHGVDAALKLAETAGLPESATERLRKIVKTQVINRVA
jgi:hypothetical protein